MEDISDQPLVSELALQSAINRSTFLNKQKYNKVFKEAIKSMQANKNTKVFY